MGPSQSQKTRLTVGVAGDQCRIDNRPAGKGGIAQVGKAPGHVDAATRVQFHPIIALVHLQAPAGELDLVQPIWSRWGGGLENPNGGRDEAHQP